MMISNLITVAQRRWAAHRRYRKVVAEIRAMSNSDLHDIGAFAIDMLEAARRERAAA